MKFGIDAFRDYFSDVGTFPIVPADIADPYTFMVESGAGCIGTPDDAIAYIENLLKGSGGFGIEHARQRLAFVGFGPGQGERDGQAVQSAHHVKPQAASGWRSSRTGPIRPGQVAGLHMQCGGEGIQVWRHIRTSGSLVSCHA